MGGGFNLRATKGVIYFAPFSLVVTLRLGVTLKLNAVCTGGYTDSAFEVSRFGNGSESNRSFLLTENALPDHRHRCSLQQSFAHVRFFVPIAVNHFRQHHEAVPLSLFMIVGANKE